MIAGLGMETLEIAADYLDGDPTFPYQLGGGRLVAADGRLRFEYGFGGSRSKIGPDLSFTEIVEVRMGNKLMGLKKGWGRILLFGAAGAAHKAATSGRRDTALRVQVVRGGEEMTLRFAVDGARGATFVEAVNDRRRGVG